jgi:peptide-methionine (S)-S-oxide reductase
MSRRVQRRNVPVFFGSKKTQMVTADEALPGRTDQTMPVPVGHHVNAHPLVGPWPAGYQTAIVGMGCFWGAERKFWQTPGVWSTAVGYAGGFTPNPSYEEVLRRSPGTPRWCSWCSIPPR